MPWFHESIVRLGSAFPSSRLTSVGSITDAVAGDRIQQALGEVLEDGRIPWTSWRVTEGLPAPIFTREAHPAYTLFNSRLAEIYVPFACRTAARYESGALGGLPRTFRPLSSFGEARLTWIEARSPSPRWTVGVSTRHP